jgi:signal transduction histidine kinase
MRVKWGRHKFRPHKARHRIFLRLASLFALFALCSVCGVVFLGAQAVSWSDFGPPGGTHYPFMSDKLVEPLAAYYAGAGGSWQGVNAWLTRRYGTEDRFWQRVLLADATGKIVADPRGRRLGQTLPPRELEQGYPIEVDGQRVGTLVIDTPLPFFPLGPLLGALALAGLVIGGMALLGSAVVSRRVAAPLADVVEAAEALAAGDLSARVAVRGRDEVAHLAETFNQMAAELQRTDELRRKLTADIAHELRTPLTVIQGNLEGLLDGVYQATPEHLELILEEIRLLSRLVEDLRLLSLAEAGQLVLEQRTVDVDGLLLDTARTFQAQADEQEITLGVQAPEQLPPALIDPQRTYQVLCNLMSNALRHTPPGGKITLAAEAREGEKSIVVSVSDTGPGIPPEDLPYIFDRFWKGDRSRSRASGGAGLGLAIARQLVEVQGGRIWATSEEGRGTTLSFTVPLAEVE